MNLAKVISSPPRKASIFEKAPPAYEFLLGYREKATEALTWLHAHLGPQE